MGKKRLKKEELAIPSTKASHKVNNKNQPEPDLYSQIFTDSEVDDARSSSQESKSSSIKSPPKHKMSHFKKPETQTVNPKGPEKRNMKQGKKIQLPVSTSRPIQTEDSSESETGDYEFDEDEEEDDDGMNSDGANGEDKDNSEEESDEEQSEESEEESDEDGESASQTALRKQLKDLSYEELESLKQKMGLKEYNEAMFASKSKTAPINKKKRKFERTNKHRPREFSSKIRVPKLREVVKVPKEKVIKDPRFDSACGEYSEKFWNTEYNFIRDIQKKEAQDMKTTIKSVGDKTKKKEMRRFIQRVNDKEKSIEAKHIEEKKRVQDKEENKKRVQEGKRPFFMKKSTKKLVELVEKYDELKSSGKLDKYLKKKRKKNAFRDKKTLTG